MIELIYRKFQFLVVRLKVGAQDKTASRVGISIPCGSIKSENSYFMIINIDISIPCGSIKSPFIG